MSFCAGAAAFLLREARSAKGPPRIKPKKALATHFWRGFVLGRGLSSLIVLKDCPQSCRGERVWVPQNPPPKSNIRGRPPEQAHASVDTTVTDVQNISVNSKMPYNSFTANMLRLNLLRFTLHDSPPKHLVQSSSRCVH